MSDPVISTSAHADPPDLDGLQIGTRIAEFEVVRRLGEGGFSIVYLAWDHSLERNIALKEYMPRSIATRVDNTRIAPITARHRETFDIALASFVNEGKLLAQFDHPSLVKVYRFWEANGTAYMVMPYYEGRTLRDTIRESAQLPGEAWFTSLLQPLTQALALIHSANCFHRDIAPDNIILLAGSGRPLLLDFGAARRVIGDRTQALTAILKPGYAPIEQYAEVPHLRQGPWTDVYALAAVLYWAIRGKTPPPSVGRMLRDSYVPLVSCAGDRYSQRFLQAIDNALKVLPEDRTQTIEAFRSDLGLEERGETDATVLLPSVVRPRLASEAAVQRLPSSGAPEITVASRGRDAPGQIPVAPGTWSTSTVFAPASIEPAPEQSETDPAAIISPVPERTKPVDAGLDASAAASTRIKPLIAGTAFAVIALAGWFWLSEPAMAPAESTVGSTEQAGARIPPERTPAVDAPSASITTTPTLETDAATNAMASLRPPIEIAASGLTSPFELGGPALAFTVTSNADGYLYLFGRRDRSGPLQLLLPRGGNDVVELVAGKARKIAVPSKTLAAQPPGSWQLWVLASRGRHDLNAADWNRQRARINPTFDPTAPGDWSQVLCAADSGTCEHDYGISQLALSTEAAPSPTIKAAVTARPSPAPAQEAAARAAESVPAATTTPPARAAQQAECARLIQRMSIGDGGAELVTRVQELGCR